MAQGYVQVSVRLTLEELERFDAAVSAVPGRSRNAMIRQVLVEWADETLAAADPNPPATRREA